MSRYADHELITREQAGNFATRIRELLGDRTQLWLATESGVGASTIAHALKGQTRMLTVHAEKLAAALGTDLEGLTGDSPVTAENGERAS